MAIDGRIVASDAALVVLGALVGGTIGARVQTTMAPPVVRRTTAIVLVVIAIVLAFRA
jgi:uncharacterized membrane protein YfcA